MSSEIADFYREKSVFITGSTGFLGKVLVEKLLRSCPDVKNIYLLIRSKRGQSVETRLKSMTGAIIFDKFNECSLNKIIPIEGDITLPGLGISEQDLDMIIREVSVVFHSAATIKFDEPLRKAVTYNVMGTQKVIQLCRKLSELSALIYVSTAYSNCNRYEIEETVYPSAVTPQKIIDLCEWMNDEMLVKITPNLVGDHPNTYTFTKHLAESLLEEESYDIPIGIVRPSIVCSSWKEPAPGWVDSITSITGFLLASGMGVFRHLFAQQEFKADLIPVDTVINLMIALVWFKSTKKSGIDVYNCTSGSSNPITWRKVLELCGPINSTKYPFSKIYRYPSLSGTGSKLIYKISILFDHFIPAHLLDHLMYLSSGKRLMVKTYTKLHRALDAMNFFNHHEYMFTIKKSMALKQLLNKTDRDMFNFDIVSLDWTAYFTDYFLGVRQYILKESNETLPRAREKMRKVFIRDICIVMAIICLIIAIISIILYKLF